MKINFLLFIVLAWVSACSSTGGWVPINSVEELQACCNGCENSDRVDRGDLQLINDFLATEGHSADDYVISDPDIDGGDSKELPENIHHWSVFHRLACDPANYGKTENYEIFIDSASGKIIKVMKPQ